MKTKMLKMTPLGSKSNFLSADGSLEIYHNGDKMSRHFGHWVLTRNGVYHDNDMYINDLAERNNLDLYDGSANSPMIIELENIKRHDVYCTLDTPFTEESPTGSYVKHEDMMEIFNRFKTTKGI